MKWDTCVLRMAAAAVLAAVFLTACGAKQAPAAASEAAGESMPASESVPASEIAEEKPDETEKFKEVFEKVEMPTYFYLDDCERYVLVEDYDGDGTQEAFAFCGRQSNLFPDEPSWETINLYYIDPDGNVTAVLGGDSTYDTINGRPAGLESGEPWDFSNSFFQTGDATFLVWNACYWEGGWFSVAMTVKDNEPILSYTGINFHKTEDGRFVAYSESGEELEYELAEDGTFVQKGSLTEMIRTEQSSLGSLSEETLKKIWEEGEEYYYEWLDLGVEESDLSYYFLPEDYDGDGAREAYVIWGQFDENGRGENINIFFVNSQGSITRLPDLYYELGLYLPYPMNGCLPGAGAPTGENQSDALIDTGDKKFLVWESEDYGPYTISTILSVEDDRIFVSEQSDFYQGFHKAEDGTYIAGFHGMSDPEVYEVQFEYSKETGDFEGVY